MAAALTPNYVLRSQPCPHHHHHHHLTAGNCSGTRGSAGRGGGGAAPGFACPCPPPAPSLCLRVVGDSPGPAGTHRPEGTVPPFSPSPARATHGCGPDLQNKNREMEGWQLSRPQDCCPPASCPPALGTRMILGAKAPSSSDRQGVEVVEVRGERGRVGIFREGGSRPRPSQDVPKEEGAPRSQSHQRHPWQ